MSDCMSNICGMDGNYCSSCAKDRRIEGLETLFKTIAHTPVAKLAEENQRLEAIIKRVSELPKRWRVEVLGGIATRHDNVRDCADELEALLEQKDE